MQLASNRAPKTTIGVAGPIPCASTEDNAALTGAALAGAAGKIINRPVSPAKKAFVRENFKVPVPDVYLGIQPRSTDVNKAPTQNHVNNNLRTV